MPRYKPPKGTRNGGRQKGTPNKATVERIEKGRIAEQAREEVDKANREGVAVVKLGKDRIEEFVNAFAGLAAFYQNKIAVSLSKGEEPNPKDLKEFKMWGEMAATHANNLAGFQSPKFKAIAVLTPANPSNPFAMREVKEIATLDPVTAARTYTEVVKAAAPPRKIAPPKTKKEAAA